MIDGADDGADDGDDRNDGDGDDGDGDVYQAQITPLRQPTPAALLESTHPPCRSIPRSCNKQ